MLWGADLRDRLTFLSAFQKIEGDGSQFENLPQFQKAVHGLIFVCLILFFMSLQQSFSYIGTGLFGLNQY